MTREEARKLLGGYATGTLNASEREALFAAALDDQELFDALMKEEPLRELLDDPASRAALLASIDQVPVRASWWTLRPLIGAVAMAGIALTAVAIWRGTHRPESVITAEVRQKTIEPAAAPPSAAPPAAAPHAENKPAPAPEKPKPTRARPPKDATREEKQAVQDLAAPAAKAEADVPAAAPPKFEAQNAAPSPLVQQQAQQQTPQQTPQGGSLGQTSQSIAVQAAPQLDRTAAVSGFRGLGAKAAFADKKVAGPVQWSILRGEKESPPGVVLDPGESIRLRILPHLAGTLTVTEGDTVLATAEVTSNRPFVTPLIPYTTAGERRLILTLTLPKAPPLTEQIILTYKP